MSRQFIASFLTVATAGVFQNSYLTVKYRAIVAQNGEKAQNVALNLSDKLVIKHHIQQNMAIPR